MLDYKQRAEGSIKDETDTSQRPLFTSATIKPKQTDLELNGRAQD
jgi:hypothetical protein